MGGLVKLLFFEEQQQLAMATLTLGGFIGQLRILVHATEPCNPRNLRKPDLLYDWCVARFARQLVYVGQHG